MCSLHFYRKAVWEKSRGKPLGGLRNKEVDASYLQTIETGAEMSPKQRKHQERVAKLVFGWEVNLEIKCTQEDQCNFATTVMPDGLKWVNPCVLQCKGQGTQTSILHGCVHCYREGQSLLGSHWQLGHLRILALLVTVRSSHFPWRRRVLALCLWLILLSLFGCILMRWENKKHTFHKPQNRGGKLVTQAALDFSSTFLSHCWWRYRNRMFVFSVTITEEKTHTHYKNATN